MTAMLDVLDVQGDFDALNDALYEKGMTDGLPVIPPSRERVERMLAGTGRDPGESLGAFPPAYNEATVAKIAVNAVMAGARPEYMPAILAAIEALLDPAFNAFGINATTHPVAPLVIFNGPVVKELNINFGYNVMGQGWRANATIGRAIRLCMLNLGGGRPGVGDMATHGHPGKIAYCMAENEERSPWDPFHVRRGFKASDSVVTVLGAEAPHLVNDHTSVTGAGIMTTQASVMATLGSNNSYLSTGEFGLVMSPEHAETVARDWTLENAQRYLFEKARLRVGALKSVGKLHKVVNTLFNPHNDDDMVPMVMSPEDILIVVAGGAGRHSMVIPSFGMSRAVSRKIRS